MGAGISGASAWGLVEKRYYGSVVSMMPTMIVVGDFP